MGRGRGLLIVLVVGAAGACSFGTYSGEVAERPTSGGPPGGTVLDAGPIQTPTDLPCDVATFLAADCLLCHGTVPTNGAPNRLDSLAALRAPAYSQPSKSNGALALERVQSAGSPMPPAPYSRATSSPNRQPRRVGQRGDARRELHRCGGRGDASAR